MIKLMKTQNGSVNPLLVSTIIFAILAIALGGLFAWAYMNYEDYKNNSDQKVAVAVEQAKTEQREADNKEFNQKYKQPYQEYQGPSDLGSVSFDYPKTWSVYESSNSAQDEGLNTYFNPKVVPPTNNESQTFALQVEVLNRSYQDYLDGFSGRIETGDAKARPYKTNDFEGIKISGQIDESHTGEVVIFKIRNSTLVLTANSEKFLDDFNKVVLSSLQFNP